MIFVGNIHNDFGVAVFVVSAHGYRDAEEQVRSDYRHTPYGTEDAMVELDKLNIEDNPDAKPLQMLYSYMKEL